MRSDRLLSLMLLLQTHGQLSAPELARRLEVSVRTILRDVEALSAAGVPVYSERGRHGGIALLPGFRTDVTGLTADEARALFVLVADQAHVDLGLGPAMGSALRKVMAALPAPFRGGADLVSRRILIDPVRWRGRGRAASSPVDLSVLQRAVFSDVRLSLRYRHGRDVQVRSYTVDPYGLVNKAGAWYLVADHRGEPKLFRVDRLLSATILEEPVRRRPGVELAEVWEKVRSEFENVPAEVRVTVDVQRSMLARILSVHGAELMTSLEDDSYDVLDGSGPVRLEFGFRSMGSAEQLLVFGEAIEVLEPTELREVLAEKALRTAALYDRAPTSG